MAKIAGIKQFFGKNVQGPNMCWGNTFSGVKHFCDTNVWGSTFIEDNKSSGVIFGGQKEGGLSTISPKQIKNVEHIIQK